jgi:sugar phosphate isomerase/epimerase
MKRREFIQTSAMITAGVVMYNCAGKPTETKSVVDQLVESKSVGLQLYSLRDIIRSDVKGTMQAVADIGFKEIECYDYNNGNIFDIPYSDFSNMVHDMGMRITSGHYKTGQTDTEFKGSLINGWEKAVEDAANAKQENMVIASMDSKERGSIDQVKKVCELINRAGEICKGSGVKMGYHNHDYEFSILDGLIPYDVMLQELDPSIVMELDLYWITFAGKDPLTYFEKYPGRFEQWHVKDMSKKDRKLQSDLGTGTIDFKAIFEKAELSGMKHYYLEQENYDVSEMDSIKNGYKYLQGI